MPLEPYPHPGCFAQRVRNCMKIKELSFVRVQKSLEECENKELESGCKGREIRSKLGIVGIYPGGSRKSGKHRTYRIRKVEECASYLKQIKEFEEFRA